jgi:DNA-binding response OmpR family regulator
MYFLKEMKLIKRPAGRGKILDRKNVLIIEDDDSLRSGLLLALEQDSISTIGAASLQEGKKLLQSKHIDLIILDCNLPDGNGIDFCQEFRKSSNIPIIFLTVNDAEIEIVSAFRVGATDYVTKPFSIMVLRERVNASLRRTDGGCNIYSDDIYYFNFDLMEYKVNGSNVILSTIEQKILKLLVMNRNMILPREHLIEAIWSVNGDFIDDNALTVAVKRLRQKIGATAIKTVYGLGYMWEGIKK